MKKSADSAQVRVLTDKVSLKINCAGVESEKKIIVNKCIYSGCAEGEKSAPDAENRIVADFNLNELIKNLVEDEAASKCLSEDFYFYGGGWQSWGFGGELAPGEFEKKYIPVIPQWKNYYTFPGKAPSCVAGKNPKSKKLLNGKFISYFRWNDVYLVIASVGNVGKYGETALAPVEYYADRKSRKITAVACTQNKIWNGGEEICELAVFAAYSFFELKAIIHSLYACGKSAERFESLKFLSSEDNKILAAGWESWYNHYNRITQDLIEGDLLALGKTENIIKTFCSDRHKPVVFQVDDGWEKGLGEWQADEKKFPAGMKTLASSIESKMYIPGLWLAPFIIDFRTDFAQKHLDWILKDEKGRYVEAGFSFAWGDKFGKMQPGKPFSYYCLDLSRDDVLEYLDSLMETAVNEWGFRYLKLDFLFAGMLYGDYKNKAASYELYDRAVKILTKRTKNNKGQEVAYLGCGLPLEPSFNYFPLSRMGSDTTENWDLSSMRPFHFACRPSAVINMQDTLGHSFWDQSVFVNDPDVIFLRYDNISMSDTEKELVAMVNYMFASQLMHSDDPSAFKADSEGKFTQHILSLYEKFEGVEFAQKNITSFVYVFFSRDKKTFGIINLSDKVFKIEKEKMLELCGINSKTEFSALVSHFVCKNCAYEIEAHSINIFEASLN